MSARRIIRSLTLLAAIAIIAAPSAPARAQRSGPPGPIELETNPFGTTLASPPLFGVIFTCHVVNIGPADIVVAVKVFDHAGTQITYIGSGPEDCAAAQPLQPGHACRMFGVPVPDFALAYCKITVSGSKEAVRASFANDNGQAVDAR
jgi:hypothetical protein